MPRGEFDRSERKARTRALLLQAAARVYARRGFDGATLDEVAEEAGFTKGAVYDHFGSKENLLVALLDEHLTIEIAEQVALFDPAKATAERPRAGADRWMTELRDDPDVFRLFVELWVHAQRDERLRRRLVTGMNAMRTTFKAFAAERSAYSGLAPSDQAAEQFATVMLALSTGIGMIALLDPDNVPPRLLGAVLSLLIGALERNADAEALLRDVAKPHAKTS
jgi:AcrR family transcriptional regulator